MSTAKELEVCNLVIDELVKRGKARDDFTIENRSKSYTSLVYDNNDFLRVKYGVYAKWISIRLIEEDKKREEVIERFWLQENKRQMHWKAQIASVKDVHELMDLIENACYRSWSATEVPLRPKEQEVADFITQEAIGWGADPDSFEYAQFSETARISYRNKELFYFKILKQKHWCLINTKLAKKHNVKLDPKHKVNYKHRVYFKDIEDLGNNLPLMNTIEDLYNKIEKEYIEEQNRPEPDWEGLLKVLEKRRG